MMFYPFIGRSCFSYTRQDEEEGEQGVTQEQVGAQSDDDIDEKRSSLAEEVSFDRPHSFVIDDSPSAGNASWFAVKSLKPIVRNKLHVSRASAIKATAGAVRERGSA